MLDIDIEGNDKPSKTNISLAYFKNMGHTEDSISLCKTMKGSLSSARLLLIVQLTIQGDLCLNALADSSPLGLDSFPTFCPAHSLC